MTCQILLLAWAVLAVDPPLAPGASKGLTQEQRARSADPPEWRKPKPRLQRRRWDALEGRPAPSLATLEGWRGSSPLSWEVLRGKLVLVYVWSVRGPQPDVPLRELAGLAMRHPRDLAVLAVHWGDGGEEAAALLNRVAFEQPAAHDAKGDFLGALAMRHPPAHFLVSREGTMRVAGLATKRDPSGRSYLEQAVDSVLGEGTADAAERQRAAALEAVAVQVDEDGWPAKVAKELLARRDARGTRAPAVTVDEWLRPPSAREKAPPLTLLYLWSTEAAEGLFTTRRVQSLAERFAQELIVLAVSPQAPDRLDESGAPWGDVVRQFVTEHPKLTLPIGIDAEDRIGTALGVTARPHAILYGRDGVIRWQGHPDDLKDPLNGALIELVARREAQRVAPPVRGER